MFGQHFRRWWQEPRRLADRVEERRISFLELFYDLVYVVVIAEVGHTLASHVDMQGILEFVFLFVLVWVAWINGSIYHEIHGNNDIRTRAFTFLQMFVVAMMAVFAHNAFGEGSSGFALAFAAYQLILTYLWWRVGFYDPLHRPLSQPYAANYLLSTILFVLSVFLPAEWRNYLWLAGLLLSVFGPVISAFFVPNTPEIRAQQEQSTRATPSIVERFGLFVIIVLGEVIVAVVRGVASHQQLDVPIIVTAGLGMLIAAGLWWLYFDFVSQHMPREGLWVLPIWVYLHLFLTMGIVAIGAATLNVVEHAGEPISSAVSRLVAGSLALTLAVIALLLRLIPITDTLRPLYRRGIVLTLAAALGCAVAGLAGIAAIPLLITLNVLLLVPILYGVKVWITVLGGAAASGEQQHSSE
jgi:low temperature requirement protein LtrA